ncbi:MAG: Npt1/Npt2 family nucleotide transporter [Phycisphaerales bacterium]|nr:Npt1/Npt2 family nucleotide transporter [Phycisphaerales bacterium]
MGFGKKSSHWSRVMPIEREELGMVLRCGACFFFLLFGYFLLRPMREAMGVQRGMNELRWLFIITCAVSLLVTLAFSSMVSKLDRRKFISFAYRIVMLCLIAFMISRAFFGDDVKRYSGYVFYIWLSVVNLFMVSVFWGFMADIWTLGSGKRVYAAIGVGGTLGALLGSNFVWWLASEIGPVWQMGLAIVMFELAVQTVLMIDRKSRKSTRSTSDTERAVEPMGGSYIDGAKAVCGSPYLLGIGLYIVLLAVSNTLLYFTQAKLVIDASDELSQRIAIFAQLDMWTQLSTLMVQLFVTSHLIKRVGVGVSLALLPIITVSGFAVLAYVSSRPGIEGWQIFATFAVFNSIHRATRYAIIRPARETLFSVLSTEDKYKAKPIVDVFLYRGGDVAGTVAEKIVASTVGGIVGMVFLVAPLAILWGGLAVALAMVQQRKANKTQDDHDRLNQKLAQGL